MGGARQRGRTDGALPKGGHRLAADWVGLCRNLAAGAALLTGSEPSPPPTCLLPLGSREADTGLQDDRAASRRWRGVEKRDPAKSPELFSYGGRHRPRGPRVVTRHRGPCCLSTVARITIGLISCGGVADRHTGGRPLLVQEQCAVTVFHCQGPGSNVFSRRRWFWPLVGISLTRQVVMLERHRFRHRGNY